MFTVFLFLKPVLGWAVLHVPLCLDVFSKAVFVSSCLSGFTQLRSAALSAHGLIWVFSWPEVRQNRLIKHYFSKQTAWCLNPEDQSGFSGSSGRPVGVVALVFDLPSIIRGAGRDSAHFLFRSSTLRWARQKHECGRAEQIMSLLSRPQTSHFWQISS